MILAKSKPIPISMAELRAIVVVVLCILILFTGIYAYIRAASMQSHCVMEVQPEGITKGNSLEERCFATQAEAIIYATGGKLNLPPGTSQSDIDKALRNQSP